MVGVGMGVDAGAAVGPHAPSNSINIDKSVSLLMVAPFLSPVWLMLSLERVR